MSCEAVREFLLENDWDAGERAQAADFLRHLDQCNACQVAMRDFDEVRLTLSPVEPSEPSGGWEAMQERLLVPIPLRRNRFLFPAMGIAASALLVVGAFHMGGRTITPAGKIGEAEVISRIEPTAPAISSKEVANQMQAFRAVSEVSEGRANWMVKSQNGSEQVNTLAAPVPSTARMLVVRLSLLQENQLISSADLLVLAGQRADLNLPLPLGRSLHYSIGAPTDEPARLSVSLEIKAPQTTEPTAAMATSLRLQPGQRVSAGRLATATGEYELKIDFAAGAESANDKE